MGCSCGVGDDNFGILATSDVEWLASGSGNLDGKALQVTLNGAMPRPSLGAKSVPDDVNAASHTR